MKVLHCITGLNTGGAENMLCKLISRLSERDVSNRVVSLLPKGALAERLQAMDVRVDTLGMERGVPSPGAVLQLVRFLREWQPDVLQTWLYHADLLGLLSARLAGKVPVVWNIRCSYMDLSQYRGMTSLVVKACSKLSSWPEAVLTNSEEARRFHYGLGYRPKSFKVIPNGFDMDRFRPNQEARAAVRNDLELDPETPLVGLVARYDPMKDHATFFRAAGLLRKTHPETRFLLCGDGITWENVALTDMIQREDLTDSVFLLGRRSDIPSLTAALDVAVNCSKGESFSNTVGEALCCGIPCVVTDVGDSARIVKDAGLVVPPENSEALCNGIVSLLDKGGKERRALGALGRERMVSSYSLEKVAGLYYGVYKDVMVHSKGRSRKDEDRS